MSRGGALVTTELFRWIAGLTCNTVELTAIDANVKNTTYYGYLTSSFFGSTTHSTSHLTDPPPSDPPPPPVIRCQSKLVYFSDLLAAAVLNCIGLHSQMIHRIEPIEETHKAITIPLLRSDFKIVRPRP